MSTQLANANPRATASPHKRHVRTLLLWLVAGYWIALFIGTHVPPADVPSVAAHNDKILHYGAYLGLTLLLTTLLWARAWPTGRILAVVVPGLLVYGAIDEVLQIFVGRTADVWDWVADAGGIATGCLIFLLLRTTLERVFRDAGDETA